ncbi:class I adenylate-forming enzyme family protein [Rhizobium laguerreae]|uniref:class I adenylate-forming enzyme family protein n=1 Tax=Rhizobium laguerreae TaxID=1076926 RepID=UPI001C904C4A|nr:class I adenylate-forming enzyme family protein [Rhizobium laguerreae]MBY3199594.1 acyl--CoA ligase [Rhizobium laguerreae]MBY3232512.1 acyl--CoA ligase [Rhizobium laguerreae]MBY3349056.1 acyl--CoA ligase [Rhizobium laguerreae]MBY3356088.1 acyl--CoA ligase [Rhizobium laguerreae]MBY3370144.1 acyl--CoA ligase [Rhizobium laguerreae]
MRFERFFDESAERFASKMAIVAETARMTYGELQARSQQLAAVLSERGVRRGDRALVFMDNCPEAAVSILGILKAGGVFSVINSSTKASKLAYIIADCEPASILTIGRLLPVVRNALSEAASDHAPFVLSTGLGAETATDRFGAFEERSLAPSQRVEHGGTADDLAMLVYTSGSTGRPKGVMMTHRNIDAASASIISYLENTPDDVIFNVLPLAFDYGLYQLLISVRLGATVVLEKSFAFPAAMFDVMRREKVTGLPLVPTMAAVLLQMRDLVPDFLPTLRYITNTAAALPVGHIDMLRRLFPGASLYSMYGLTECKRCTYLPPSELARRPDSVGIAIPGTEAFVVDGDGRVVAPNVTGELVIQGHHVMQGYWKDEAATARALRPGPNPDLPALYTGDLFRRDEAGFLYFVARRDDIIKTRGEKVAPKEVETVLHAHPAVVEAVVTGIFDGVLGQAVSAMVVSRDAAVTAKELIRHCQLNLEEFMVPKYLTLVESLPKTDTGKVSRKRAGELLESAR